MANALHYITVVNGKKEEAVPVDWVRTEEIRGRRKDTDRRDRVVIVIPADEKYLRCYAALKGTDYTKYGFTLERHIWTHSSGCSEDKFAKCEYVGAPLSPIFALGGGRQPLIHFVDLISNIVACNQGALTQAIRYESIFSGSDGSRIKNRSGAHHNPVMEDGDSAFSHVAIVSAVAIVSMIAIAVVLRQNMSQ